MNDKIALVFLALAVSCAGAQAAVTSENLEAIPASQFVYTPPTPSPNALSVGGVSQRRTAREWPALEGLGISQTSFTLEPCAVRSPHIHQNAAGLLYAINAESLMVGFVQENGTAVENTITSGTSAVFPQGLVHYQYNTGCSPATYTITYNDAQGATVNIVPALVNLPQAVVMASLNISEMAYAELVLGAPTTNFIAEVDECMAKCTVKSQSTQGRRLLGAQPEM
ncbi:hypothetical protein ACKKBF_B18695 [Auxenochlorella protothecoides x Auxenochlorella symbiontica]